MKFFNTNSQEIFNSKNKFIFLTKGPEKDKEIGAGNPLLDKIRNEQESLKKVQNAKKIAGNVSDNPKAIKVVKKIAKKVDKKGARELEESAGGIQDALNRKALDDVKILTPEEIKSQNRESTKEHENKVKKWKSEKGYNEARNNYKEKTGTEWGDERNSQLKSKNGKPVRESDIVLELSKKKDVGLTADQIKIIAGEIKHPEQMTKEEFQKALEKKIKASKERNKRAKKDRENNENTYKDPETGEFKTEPVSQHYAGANKQGQTPRAGGMSSGPSGGSSGTFDAPNIKNGELMKMVETLAGQLGVEPAALKAVVAVESGGKMNATRFEKHHAAKGRDNATSFGAFQIMGFNAKSLGYSSATEMKEKFKDPKEQVKAFGMFLKTRGLVRHLKNKNWTAFAEGYNGKQQKGYDRKIESAYRQYGGK